MRGWKTVLEARPRVPSFADVNEAKDALRKKDNFIPADLYPRDGTVELAKLEAQYADFVGLTEGSLLLYNSGMSAVVEAIESGYPTKDDVIAHGNQLYSQSTRYISEQLRKRGIRPVAINAGSVDEIDSTIKRHRPKIVFLETIANAPDMSVLDVDAFLSLESVNDVNPLIILDNTVPTPSVLPLGPELKTHADQRILVVESGTKSYALNRELLGLVYGHDDAVMGPMRERRRTTGTLLSNSAIEVIGETSFATKEEFHERNKRGVSNTLKLAQSAFEGTQGGSKFLVSHPNLHNHTNFDYVRSRFPEGCSLVFFIQCIDNMDQFQLTEALWESVLIRRYCELGQSFAFDKTRIWPDANFPTVRISGGTESPVDVHALSKEFLNILKSLK